MSNLYYDEGSKHDGRPKALIATTAYETTSPGYVYSIQKSRLALEAAGINSGYLLLSGNCHVDDARNVVVQHFLLSDCDFLIFIDADVYWQTDALVKLCQADADVVGGVYPYRREGQNEKLPFIPMPDIREADETGLMEVLGLPTGFLKIQRHVLETLAKEADHFPNRAETRSKIPLIFERVFEDGARWGGDIVFCKKWQKTGGKVYAYPELRLGHTGSVTLYDSVAAATRRQDGNTLEYMVERVRNNDFNPYLFAEVIKAEGNPYTALEDVMMMSALLARKADAPILEVGSGITSLVLAASTDQTVYCLEHDEWWADKLKSRAEALGLNNIYIMLCDIKNGWYELPDILPKKFSMALVDAPPRDKGDRMKFFDYFPDIPTIIVDDADNPVYANSLTSWAGEHDRKIDFVERSALIRSAA